MKKGYTTVEQSKRLIELGINPNTADFVTIWYRSREGGKYITMPKETLDAIRTPFTDIIEEVATWSLTALLELMPIVENNTPVLHQNLDKRYYYHISEDFGSIRWETKIYDTPIDAAVEVIGWAIGQGCIKTNK